MPIKRHAYTIIQPKSRYLGIKKAAFPTAFLASLNLVFFGT